MPSWRQIARSVPIGISRWRGSDARRSRVVFDQIECFCALTQLLATVPEEMTLEILPPQTAATSIVTCSA